MELSEHELLVLGEVRAAGEVHAYAVARELERREAMVFTLGALYKTLHRLEISGFIRGRWEQIDPSVEKRPKRRLYELTAVGERAFHSAVRQRALLFSGRFGGATL